MMEIPRNQNVGFARSSIDESQTLSSLDYTKRMCSIQDQLVQ